MAITKIHAIKSTLGKALAYIENPDKTDGQMLVSGYNCEPQTASIDFEMTAVLAHKARNLKRKRSTNLAYHLIQSFSPEDAVTPEQAHELGKKLAFEYTGGKYEYVVATHIDKGHIHNHIMLNAVSFYDYKTLRTVPYRTARQIRDISDRLCMEAHLSVIDDPQKIGQLYPENAGKKKSASNRTEIRKRLDFCLERATDYSQFLSMAEGLEITPTIRGKHMSYLLEGAGRAVRDNSLSDTDTFTYAGICARLSDNAQEQKYLRKTITGILRSATGMADFADKLKTAGIETKVKKSTGQVLYRAAVLDGAWVPEDALGSEFTSEGIEYALKNGEVQIAEDAEITLIDRLSRFARNTVDALNATRELKQYGVEVYFVNDGIWTMDGDGEVRLTIMASIAQDESRKTSERVKAGQKMSREKGVLYGSGNIIGYDRVDGTYVINEEQAATVRRIFNLYAEGHGETTVAKMLIEENRKDGGGGLSWTASKVSRVLRKPTYKGYMTYNKSHIDDFLSHNRINHSEEDFVLVKGNFEPIVSEELWETCNQIRSKRAAFVKGKDGRAHKFGVSFPQNKWTKILFCDCGMRFQIEGYDKTANGGKNMRLICARSKMFKKKDAARALNGIPCPAPYASEWKLELMAREVFRTVWKENAEDILGLLRMLDADLNTTGTPNDGNQLENKLSALNKELDDLVSQRASRSITMDDFLSKSTEINNEIINVEGLLQSSIQEQRPKARLDMHSIEAALSDDASFPDGKIEPGFLDRYANRIVKSNNRYIWMLQLMNVQQIMPIQSERQPIAMVTYKSGVPYDIEQEQIGKQDKESAGLDCATICRPQDFFLNMGRTTRKRKLVEWLESCQENQVSVLDEKIPLLSFAVDFVTAYEYQKARGIKIHPGLWKDMRVDIFLVKKEN